MKRQERAELIVREILKRQMSVDEVREHLDTVANSQRRRMTRELNQWCAGANTPCGWCECCRVNRVINFKKLLDKNMKEIKNAEPIKYPHRRKNR
jgi:hypothetical protein